MKNTNPFNHVGLLYHLSKTGGRFRKNKLETAEQIQNGNTSEMLHPALKSLLQKIYSVNENRVSKVVDENGEPLVVYHGSNHWFNIFNEEKLYHLPKSGGRFSKRYGDFEYFP